MLFFVGRVPYRVPAVFCFVYLLAVCAWDASGTAAVAWGWAPGRIVAVRGRHDAANGIMFDRSYRADPERPNVVSSDGLAL